MASPIDELRVGGLVRLSSIDWPGELVATVFLQGCPWRCPYCHNPHLLASEPSDDAEAIAWPEVTEFLTARVGLLDGVVFSGGEPLAQRGLADAIASVRGLGLRVALHTGGALPERFSEVLPQLSWVGLDVKAPFGDYAQVTGVAGSGERALAALRRLAASDVPYEVRTTVDPALLGPEDLRTMAAELSREGVTHWVIQPVRFAGGEIRRATPGFDDSWLAEADRARFARFEVRD